MSSPPPKLPFSDKYDLDHARAYEEKHRSGLRRRLTTWRELALARRALRLAGDPESVLDMPCGAGRFWPMLAEHPTRRLRAGDRSAGMLETARKGLASKPVSWVPIVGWSLPDEKQLMRIRLKVAVIDVRAGHWSVFSPEPFEDQAVSANYGREAADQSQVQKLKQKAYEAAVKDLLRIYGG